MKRIRKQSGLAAIETMIAAPIVFMMLALAVDVGRAFVQYTMLNKAVQNGARYAISSALGGGSVGDYAQIRNIVVYGNSAGGGGSVINSLTTSDVTITESSNYVTVTASYSYSPVFLKIPYTDIDTSITFSASSVMRTGV